MECYLLPTSNQGQSLHRFPPGVRRPDGDLKRLHGTVFAKYIDFSQEDWEDWLPMAEFSANNVASASTGISPFFANKGFYPRMSFGPPRPLSRNSTKRLQEQEEQGNAFALKMESIMETLRTNLLAAQATQEKCQQKPHCRPGLR